MESFKILDIFLPSSISYEFSLGEELSSLRANRAYNYQPASQAIFGDDRLLKNPDLVATNDTLAWDVSFWYWSTRVHDAPGISEGKFGVSINEINGGEECGPNAENKASPQSRFKYYKNICAVWKIPSVPDETGCWN